MNPFNAHQDTEITRVFDENKSSKEYMVDYCSKHAILDENEFYVLFEGGVLCKKGRSGLKSSDYQNNVKPQKIKEYYEVL